MPSISTWSAVFNAFIVVGAFLVLVGTVGSIKIRTVEKKEQNRITENQTQELQKTRENQKKAAHIKTLIDKVKNGSRSAYEELDRISDVYPDLTEEQYEPIENAYFSFRKIFGNHVREKSNIRLIDLDTKKTKKWSSEYLYYIFKFSNRAGIDEDARIAAVNEAGRMKCEYLTQELYNIAVHDEKLFLGISAAHAICKITDYAPYRNRNRFQSRSSEKEFLSDIPKFDRLTRWWKEKGSQQKRYMCPFGELITNDRNYFYYGESHPESSDFQTAEQRLGYLKEILPEYPKLSRTRAEMAYLLLGDEATFLEVKSNALQSLEESDSEPLPSLLLAYISFVTKDGDNCKKWISKAIESSRKENILVCLQINEKLHVLLPPVIALLEK